MWNRLYKWFWKYPLHWAKTLWGRMKSSAISPETELGQLSQSTYQGILNNIIEAVYILDENGVFLDVNLSSEKLYGYSRNDIIGQTQEFLSAPGKNDLARIVESVRKAYEGESQQFEFWGQRKDGSIFPKEVSLTPGSYFGRRVILAVARDISQCKRVEEELRWQTERYHRLFFDTPLMYISTRNQAGIPIVTECNQAFLSSLGYTLAEVRGQALSDFYTPESRKELLEDGDYQRALEHSFTAKERGLVTRAGQVIYTMLTAVPETDAQGSVIGTRAMYIDITERKQAEEQLRILSRAVEHSASAIVVTDALGTIEYVNPKFTKVTGFTFEEAVGQNPRILKSGLTPQEEYKRMWMAITAGEEWRGEFLNRKKNGELYWESATISPVFNERGETTHIIAVNEDITERKRSETIMQKRFELMEYADQHSLEEIMQKIIDEVSNLTGSNVGFFIMEADQTSPGLQSWPANTLSLFDVPVSEGQHWSVEQAGAWAEAVRHRRSIIHNDYKSLPNKKILPPGHAPIIREMLIPFFRNEKILAVIGMANKLEEYTQEDLETAEQFADYAWDITERKQMELALAQERNQLALRVEERTADLSHANANLARALHVKDEFLANMSHELRTPLNAILGLSESLAEQTAGPLNEKQQRYINTVNESGHHLLSLINDILDLAKIEAGQITMNVSNVDINSVCQASLRMIKQLAQKKDQEIVLEIDSRVRLMQADERHLKQMLVNLLGNASKFTPQGGKFGLEVHGDQDANKVIFTIWDTGIGIEEIDLPRLFKPFVQLDAGLARESSGTGLGLALVAKMARLHGGSVSVTSQPGKGSRFTIMLPCEPALTVDHFERSKSAGKLRPVKFTRDHQPTILLIEDIQEVIMMISDYLELNGYKIVTAYNGEEGIIQAQRTHPDLILMDLQMPQMDGFEATKNLRSKPEFTHTPIIALTALAMQNDRERCLAVGMDEYITKPVHLRVLKEIIEGFLAGEKEIKPQ